MDVCSPRGAGPVSGTCASSLALKAVQRLQSLPGLQLIEMEHSLIREAAHLAAELGLRGVHSTYVAVAARLDLPLISLNADQRQRAAKHVKILKI